MIHPSDPTPNKGFADFLASGVRVDDLSIPTGADFDGKAQPGILFDDLLYVEVMDDGRFYLILGREEWISDTLEPLAVRLYVWALDEGYFQGGA